MFSASAILGSARSHSLRLLLCSPGFTKRLFAKGVGFTQLPKKAKGRPVEEDILRSLNQSKEPFIKHYRTCYLSGEGERCCLPKAYEDMPIWVAVEVLSFGVISKMLKASEESGVLKDVAESMSVSKKIYPVRYALLYTCVIASPIARNYGITLYSINLLYSQNRFIKRERCGALMIYLFTKY
ncbi:Abi family protein [Canibacter sp. lx-72]|nr:Abi family protein [Canibacter zhuwentaonis]